MMKNKLGMAALAATLFSGGASAQQLTIVSFGGAYQEGQSKALFLSLIHI